jgi:hypothetical protein
MTNFERRKILHFEHSVHDGDDTVEFAGNARLVSVTLKLQRKRFA